MGLGLLTRWCPPELVDEVVDKHGRSEQRRRLLTARMMTYFELARCLYPRLGYEQALRRLIALDAGQNDQWHVPNKSSLCRARSRLGPDVLEELFHRISGPIAEEATCPAAFWRGLRLAAIDGTFFAIADTPANATSFPLKGANIAEGAGCPQVEVEVLIEVGTRAAIAAAIGDINDNEISLARKLTTSIAPSTLVLADRNMMGVELWHAFTKAGADLLWRIRPRVARHPDRELDDGTYLATVRVGSRLAKQHRQTDRSIPNHITVRVIEYRVDGNDELYRLATSLLDPETAPAPELAALYQQCWEAETAYAELKTCQRGSGAVLRSSRPEGVRQEVWAHLIVHHLTRQLIQQAATRGPTTIDPDRISFPRAQEAARRHLQQRLSPL
ncbi:IS4 family transposase [Streptomyces sp. NPDC001833]|uniref:IS4 family transposase n=1 Tax=Streptomyces sp. NPDC001833 TaxID=3154658 RepID=UPI0033176ED2